MKTLINTVFLGDVDMIAAYKFSPDKIILLIPEKLEGNSKKVVPKAVKDIKATFEKLKVRVETKQTAVYDLKKIIKDVMGIIDEEHKEGNEVMLHISEGRKVQSFACMLAAYKRKDKVSACYYLIEETGQALSLPLLDFSLTHAKKGILEEINKGVANVLEIAKNLKISKALAYKLLKELKHDGFIKKEENELTESGRIAIL